MPRGGKRKGAGRPRGKGPWKEATKPLRIPVSFLNAVTNFMETSGYKLPMFASRVPAGTPENADDHVDKTTDLQGSFFGPEMVKQGNDEVCRRFQAEAKKGCWL